MYKKEYQKYGISSWKCYSRDDIDRLCHTNGMGRFLFAHLNEAGLQVIRKKSIIRSSVFDVANSKQKNILRGALLCCVIFLRPPKGRLDILFVLLT